MGAWAYMYIGQIPHGHSVTIKYIYYYTGINKYSLFRCMIFILIQHLTVLLLVYMLTAIHVCTYEHI